MKKIILIFLVCILFISGCIQEPTTSKRILESAKVIEVIDGDTVKLENGDTIRLLHINTAEKGERCYEEAKERLKELVENKTVWLERDMQNTDQYDRKLRYIFLGYNTNPENYDDFVNLILIDEGLAALLIIEPNMKYKSIFESTIEKTEGCLFEKSSFFGCFSIKEFNYDPEGSDCEIPNEEYVIIKNGCDDINMNGWIIKDSARHVYTFEDFILSSGASFTLHSGSGNDNETDLYWNRGGKCPVVWNNDGDSLFLRDSDEKLVLYYNY
ncbi:MAG: lamin tail domain-containing protein [Candidatus Pacearchaeota archaeon]|nr:MAG: lamin tail domain-containing protein [Candidatus Pacearchaeota archaeon]